MRIHCTASYAAAMLCVAIASGQAQVDSFPLRFTSRAVFGTDAFLERPVGAALTADGGLVISDLGSRKIIKFRDDGTLEWRVGREGRGPGEYIAPVRVVGLSDGAVLVHDVGRPQLTRLNRDGSYRDMVDLDAEFIVVDNVVALANGGIAICGIARPGGRADSSAAIHVFDAKFRHVRSFGPVPPMRNLAMLGYWGAGGLSVGPEGELVFTRRHPYEIYRYTTDGKVLGVVRATLPLTGTPDDAFAPQQQGGQTTVTAAPNVTLTRKAYVLADGRVLSGRITGRNRTLDLFSATGTAVATRDGLPPGWLQIAAYDSRRRMIWVFAEVDDAPVLLRFRVQ